MRCPNITIGALAMVWASMAGCPEESPGVGGEVLSADAVNDSAADATTSGDAVSDSATDVTAVSDSASDVTTSGDTVSDSAADVTTSGDTVSDSAADVTTSGDTVSDSAHDATTIGDALIADADGADTAGGCPSEPVDIGGACNFAGQCAFGTECCCGECYDSLVCTCDGGVIACFYTDACLIPSCPDADAGGQTPDANSTDASSPGDEGPGADVTGLQPGQCEDQSDCSMPAFLCFAPDEELPCGICMTPPDTCTGDAECKQVDADTICQPEKCACGGESTCQQGCLGDDANCEQGESCAADGHCVPSVCSSTAGCPLNFVCTASVGCERKACASSADCDAFCVKGACHSEPGYCSPPPP